MQKFIAAICRALLECVPTAAASDLVFSVGRFSSAKGLYSEGGELCTFITPLYLRQELRMGF